MVVKSLQFRKGHTSPKPDTRTTIGKDPDDTFATWFAIAVLAALPVKQSGIFHKAAH